MFTLDYTQYCKTQGHVLAGVKIVDRSTRNPKGGSLLMVDGENAQGNEELTCISLHFVNAKESHEICMSDLKPFFDFGKKCLNVVLGSQNIPTTVPLKLYAFPMDVSAE